MTYRCWTGRVRPKGARVKSKVQLLVLSILVGLFSSTAAFAGIEEGDFRISAGIAAVTYNETDIESNDFETTTVQIASGALLQLGKVTSETVELGLRLGVFFEEFDTPAGQRDATTVEVVPYVALNFPIESFGDPGSTYFSPSLGLGYSGSFSDAIDVNAVLLELGVETKFFVAKDASVDLGLFFTYASGTAETQVRDDLDVEAFTIGPRIKISIWP